MARETQIVRELGLFTATALVVANMVGTGIFTTSGLMAGHLPSAAWVMGCWLLGGTIALAGALCYGELATRMPDVGGEYIYLRRLYHPALGFLTGWTSFFVGFSAPAAGSALGFAEYTVAGLNQHAAGIDAAWSETLKKALAITVILTFTLLHFLGLRWGARVQNILTVFKVALILALASGGLLLGSGHWSNFSLGGHESFRGLGFGVAMMLVMFSYSGWNASAYMAGELKDPSKTLPRSLALGTAIVVVLYLALNAFIFYASPYSEVKGTITIVEAAAVHGLGDWVGRLVGFLIAFALLSSLSAFIMIGARVYFAMAKNRLFFRFAAEAHPRYRVPGKSIVAQGIVASLMVVIGSFEQLLISVGFALGIFPWLAVAGLFIARKHGIGDASAVTVWGFPFIPLFFLTTSLALMAIAFVSRPLESSVAVLTVLFGIPCYFLWVKGTK